MNGSYYTYFLKQPCLKHCIYCNNVQCIYFFILYLFIRPEQLHMKNINSGS